MLTHICIQSHNIISIKCAPCDFPGDERYLFSNNADLLLAEILVSRLTMYGNAADKCSDLPQ